MSSIPKTQELPPPGGFSRIVFERIPHKTFMNGKTIALWLGVSYAVGAIGVIESAKSNRRVTLEAQSGQNAIQPFLLAERDRQLMRQMRKNRDAEADLMKNVEGWEVGTLFGTPVFNTVGENEWIGVTPESYYVHADPSKVDEYVGHQLWV